jgi:hypothetical protein
VNLKPGLAGERDIRPVAAARCHGYVTKGPGIKPIRPEYVAMEGHYFEAPVDIRRWLNNPALWSYGPKLVVLAVIGMLIVGLIPNLGVSELPRVFRSGDLRLIRAAAACPFR